MFFKLTTVNHRFLNQPKYLEKSRENIRIRMGSGNFGAAGRIWRATRHDVVNRYPSIIAVEQTLCDIKMV